MIDYNKYMHQPKKTISLYKAPSHIRTSSKKRIKLTRENKAFLKAIGLLK